MIAAYAAALADAGPGEAGVWQLEVLLQDTGHLQEAYDLRERRIESLRASGDEARLQASLGNQALILKARGDLDGAMALLKEQERICRELGDPAGLATSLANQGLLLVQTGRRGEGLALVEEAHETAAAHGLDALRQQIEPLLQQLR